MDMTYLANRLRTCREAKGLTLKEVGRQVGRTESGVGAWERARTEPDHDTLEKLAELYDVDISTFFERGHKELSLSAEEFDMVLDFRELDARGKDVVRSVVVTMLENQYKTDLDDGSDPEE